MTALFHKYSLTGPANVYQLWVVIKECYSKFYYQKVYYAVIIIIIITLNSSDMWYHRYHNNRSTKYYVTRHFKLLSHISLRCKLKEKNIPNVCPVS